MKNDNYVVLKKIYKTSQRDHTKFVPKNTLLEKGCSETTLNYLDFNDLITYLHENKEDFYCISNLGIEYLHKYESDQLNLLFTFVTAMAAVIGAILTVIA